jgi:hypothetical protein
MFSKQFWAVLGALAVLAVALEHSPASPAQRGLVRIAPCAICPPAGWQVWFASQAELPVAQPALRHQPVFQQIVQQSGQAQELPSADLFASPTPTPAAPRRPSADAWHS